MCHPETDWIVFDVAASLEMKDSVLDTLFPPDRIFDHIVWKCLCSPWQTQCNVTRRPTLTTCPTTLLLTPRRLQWLHHHPRMEIGVPIDKGAVIAPASCLRVCRTRERRVQVMNLVLVCLAHLPPCGETLCDQTPTTDLGTLLLSTVLSLRQYGDGVVPASALHNLIQSHFGIFGKEVSESGSKARGKARTPISVRPVWSPPDGFRHWYPRVPCQGHCAPHRRWDGSA